MALPDLLIVDRTGLLSRYEILSLPFLRHLLLAWLHSFTELTGLGCLAMLSSHSEQLDMVRGQKTTAAVVAYSHCKTVVDDSTSRLDGVYPERSGSLAGADISLMSVGLVVLRMRMV